MIFLVVALTAAIVLAESTPSPTPVVAPQKPPSPVRVVPQPQPQERSVIGNLDKVDVAAMQIVVATATGSKLTFSVQTGASIRQGSRTLTPAELARHKGERVKVRYQETAGARRTTSWITLAAPPQKKTVQ